MHVVEGNERGVPQVDAATDYPLRETAAVLNHRLGLYFSEPQLRVFAGLLLVGTAVASAAVTWSLGRTIRRTIR